MGRDGERGRCTQRPFVERRHAARRSTPPRWRGEGSGEAVRETEGRGGRAARRGGARTGEQRGVGLFARRRAASSHKIAPPPARRAARAPPTAEPTPHRPRAGRTIGHLIRLITAHS